MISGTSGTRTLTIGQGDFGGGNYQGSIQNGAAGTTALTKTGTGTITLSGTNTYTGATAINVGKLFINGNQTSANGAVSVAATATLGGTGTIGGSTTIAATGKLEFNLSTAPGSHDKLDLASAKTLTFSGASVLTITSSGGASPGTLHAGHRPRRHHRQRSRHPQPAKRLGGHRFKGRQRPGAQRHLHRRCSPGETFAEWIGGFTGLGGLTAFDDDADGDGIKNGIEAFFGTAPNAPNAGLSAIAFSGNALTFTHPKANPPLTNVTGSYEWSLDLSAWNASGANVGGTILTIGAVQDTPESGTTTVTAAVTGTEPGQVFVRAVATQN